jgi:hypothetical protein
VSGACGGGTSTVRVRHLGGASAIRLGPAIALVGGELGAPSLQPFGNPPKNRKKHCCIARRVKLHRATCRNQQTRHCPVAPGGREREHSPPVRMLGWAPAVNRDCTTCGQPRMAASIRADMPRRLLALGSAPPVIIRCGGGDGLRQGRTQ